MNRILAKDAEPRSENGSNDRQIGDRQIYVPSPPKPKLMGVVNWVGLWTLYEKEILRFLKVFLQTLLAPIITTLLFLAIFSLALGGAVRQIHGIPFVEFLAPGLVMMAMVQNAFANTSSSMLISKVQGSIVDVLMPPLSPMELTIGYAMSGATRGMAVGAMTVLGMWIFVPIQIQNLGIVLYFAFMASLMLSFLGLIGGIWADKHDHIAAVTNFVITPLAFLSGTFYSIDRLPGIWNDFAHINPFFFMIDGFRSGFIGRSDSSPLIGMAVLAVINIGLWWLTHWMFRSGYKLKS